MGWPGRSAMKLNSRDELLLNYCSNLELKDPQKTKEKPSSVWQNFLAVRLIRACRSSEESSSLFWWMRFHRMNMRSSHLCNDFTVLCQLGWRLSRTGLRQKKTCEHVNIHHLFDNHPISYCLPVVVIIMYCISNCLRTVFNLFLCTTIQVACAACWEESARGGGMKRDGKVNLAH